MRMLTLLGLLGVSVHVVELEQAQAQFDAGDFDDALRTIDRGLTQAELSDDQLVELYKLQGLSHLYLGNEDQARGSFEKLLTARPDYEVPKAAPPKVRSLYARIKEDIKKRRVRPVTLVLEPPQAVRGGAALVLAARVEDLGLGAKAKLFFRRAGAQGYSSADFVRDKASADGFTVTVPAYELPAEERGYDVEYYVEVADAAQRRLAGRGDAYNPLVLRVAAKGGEAQASTGAQTPWYKIPWVWVGVGVGVAAIATTTVVLATQRQQATVSIAVTVQTQ